MKNKDLAKNLVFDLDQLVPGQSVDCVIMGFDQNELKILVLKWKVEGDFWALPGGFVFKDEDLERLPSEF